MTASSIESPAIPRRRRRLLPVLAALVLAALAIGLWVTHLSRVDRWPSRVTLMTDYRDHPLGFSPDGRIFLTSGEKGITPWDTSTGVRGKPWPVSGGRVFYDGVFSPDGRTYAAAIPSHPSLLQIALYDVASGRLRMSLDSDQVKCFRLTYSADGRSIRAVLGDNSGVKQVVTWDVTTGREASRWPISRAGTTLAPSGGYPWSVASFDGRIMATTSIRLKDVEFRDLDTDKPLGTLVKPTGVPNSWGLAFSDDGKTLAVARYDNSIETWDVATRTLIRSIPVHSPGYESQAIRFLPDGKTLISTGLSSPFLPGSSTLDRFRSVASKYIPILAPAQHDEAFFVDLGTGKLTPSAPSTIYPIISPDGRTMATREPDLRIKLRDVPPPGP